ncbi:MAG: GDP-mannose 4,6-dehydratase, partial [Moorea sp. SIO4G2]|nr:GDP-mannose 4,6-dehydratase [Moorena sp. SIO4G2]
LMVEADLQALGLSSANGKSTKPLNDQAYIRQGVATMVD